MHTHAFSATVISAMTIKLNLIKTKQTGVEMSRLQMKIIVENDSIKCPNKQVKKQSIVLQISFMNKNQLRDKLLIQSPYQGSRYLSFSLTCGLTLDLYDPGTTDVNERLSNTPADNTSHSFCCYLCGKKGQPGLCRLVINRFIVTKQ